MTARKILSKNSMTDTEKLLAIFEINKDTLKIDYPSLYYAILGVRDEIRQAAMTSRRFSTAEPRMPICTGFLDEGDPVPRKRRGCRRLLDPFERGF